MTKADIVELVYQRIGGMSRRESAEVVDKLVALMKDVLSKGENIKIAGFGNFIVQLREARNGFDPRTKRRIMLPCHRTLRFRISPLLRDHINRNVAEQKGTAVIRNRTG